MHAHDMLLVNINCVEKKNRGVLLTNVKACRKKIAPLYSCLRITVESRMMLYSTFIFDSFIYLFD